MDGYLRSDDKRITPLFDETLRLLADRRRRRALRYVARAPDDSVSLDAVAAAVHERGTNGDARRTVQTTLHHVHLPRLADADVVAYDPGRRRVRYLGDPLVERFMDLLDRGEAYVG